ncbi:unnamed protein product [Durusdinium trenchii]|uniref:Uncharacterized protein n=1 Tax=Durusdinium trenchii TaxID=1381693 RepID=A0ABP0KB62_9DINO
MSSRTLWANRVQALTEQLKSGDAELTVKASSTLVDVCFCFEPSEEHRAETFSLGALDVLVKGLRNHPGNANVQNEASFALGNVCAYSEERSAEAFKLGALDLLVEALRNHPGNADVQAGASFALGNVCRCSQKHQAEAFTLGALDLLVEALRNHPRHSGVQIWASHGLGQVCWGSTVAQGVRKRAIELGAFELIVSNLPPMPSGKDYFRFWALGSLCFGSDPAALDRQQKALSLGTLGQVKLMLKEEKGMQEQGTAVLQLLKKNDICRMVLQIVSAPWSLWQWAHPASSHSTNPAAESSEASPQSREAREATETSPSEAARNRRGVAEAEKDLQAAIKSRDVNRLRKAIEEAEEFGVETAILYEAQKALTNLVESGPISPSIQLLQDEADDLTPMAPMGIQICHAIDALFQLLTHEHEASKSVGRETLERCCQKAQKTSDELLKSSIFGLMNPDEIKHFLLAADHQMWMEIRQNTEDFLNKLLKEPGIRVEDRPKVAEMMRPDAINSHLRQMRPVIMDHTVREPATTTPFGHTGYMKWLTLKIIQKMNIKDIAISGQYYGSSYTPETQILEWLHYKGESMDGMVVMFAPGEREAGIKAIRDYQIPNAFLDLTLKASVRFAETNFATTVQTVLDAVKELDQIFSEMGLAHEPWRNDEEVNSKHGSGEISLNLVDLMEFLDLKTNGEMNSSNQKSLEDAFAKWKANKAFQRRVVAILTEEGRGCANYLDYGKVVEWLRSQFPQKKNYRILIHAHAGPGNTQDAASIEAVLHGGNGVWAGIIPQAAQGGHNSSLVFLDNMLRLGNQHVLEDYWLHQAAQSARYVYYLNFNTYTVPDDCPIWGAQVERLLHTAFSTVEGEEWRRRRGNYYNMWGRKEEIKLETAVENSKHHKAVSTLRIHEKRGKYRLSPLVSDVKTWEKRLGEDLSILDARDVISEYVAEVRMLAFALMNAGLRVNIDAPSTLRKLVEIVKRNRSVIQRCRQVDAYQKAGQHQGDEE